MINHSYNLIHVTHFLFLLFQSVLSLENLKQHLYTDLHNASTEASLIYNATTGRPLIYNASTERPLINNVSTELYPVNDASTKQSFVMKEAVFSHVPAAKFNSDEEEVKTDIADGAVSSAEADKVIFKCLASSLLSINAILLIY